MAAPSRGYPVAAVRTLPLLFLLAACRHDAADFDATAEIAEEMPTVAWVRWTTPEPGTSWVEFGTTDELGRTTVRGTEPTTEHEVLVGGLPADRKVWVRAYTQVGDQVLQGPLQKLETGELPGGLPDVEPYEDDQPELAYGGFSMVPILGFDDEDGWVLVLDQEGELVWWLDSGADEKAISQAWLSKDGTSILYSIASSDRDVDIGTIYRVRLDGTPISETVTPLAHHDFIELPGGGFAYLYADIRPYAFQDGEQDVVGDALVEIDEGGTELRTIWSTWDMVGDALPMMDPDDDSGFYPQGLDWAHANNLVYDPTDDTYLVSLRNLDRLLKIDRQTGDVLWQLGGDQSDFTQTAGRAFIGQHSPSWTEDGTLLLFDNGDFPADNSKVVEFEVDQDARTYGEIWSYDGGGNHQTVLMGDAERLANGSTFVSWGSAGRIEEVTPDGTLAVRADMGIGTVLGFSNHVEAFGGVEGAR